MKRRPSIALGRLRVNLYGADRGSLAVGSPVGEDEGQVGSSDGAVTIDVGVGITLETPAGEHLGEVLSVDVTVLVLSLIHI